jgi:NTP pyrophosphatase (non-canonical NTP hydrolase)
VNALKSILRAERNKSDTLHIHLKMQAVIFYKRWEAAARIWRTGGDNQESQDLRAAIKRTQAEVREALRAVGKEKKLGFSRWKAYFCHHISKLLGYGVWGEDFKTLRRKIWFHLKAGQVFSNLTSVFGSGILAFVPYDL